MIALVAAPVAGGGFLEGSQLIARLVAGASGGSPAQRGSAHVGSRSSLRRRAALLGAGVAAVALVAAGCSSSSSASGTTPVKGGTAVMSEPPSLPFEWQPFPACQITEVANNLKGCLPQSPTLSINPENWYFVK